MSESTLRQRQTKLDDVAPKPETPRVKSKKTIRSKVQNGTFILSLLLSACFLFYRPPMSPLPNSYVVCCRRGNCIVTVDEADTRVECMAIHGSKIVDTGPRKTLKKRWSKTAPLAEWAVRYVESGTIVVPGLSDSHAHILEYGATRRLPLESGKTIEANVALVSQYILDNEDILNDTTRCVESWGWDHTSWPIQEFPTAEHLDADPIIRGRPIVLQSKDGHAIWVSKSLLESNKPFPDTIEGGVIVRDADGNPTGVFVDNAQDLIKRPPLTQVDLQKRFKATVDDALAFGLTSIHDAGLKPASLEFFKKQAAETVLPIRIYGMTYFDDKGEYWGNKTTPLIGAGLGGRLDARSVKIFADGALRSGGAALHAPYSDNPDTRGFLVIDEGLLKTVIPQFLKDGWQVNVHAIGDRANAIVIDAFESALAGINVTALRPRLEHAQIMTKADMARLAQLGVIASVQPTHAISDMWYAQDRLGPERVKILYAFRTLIDSGARIAFGSDFPVEDMNPLSGFYAAVSRLSPDGKSPHGPDGWFPDQRLTRAEALRGMTIDAAYASFAETKLGSLVPGKLADFVILSQDILSVPLENILATKVLATVIDGRPAFGGF